MAQEIVLGFHVNEEHGEMFISIFMTILEEAVIDMLINSREILWFAFLVILVFPIGNPLSTRVCLPCPVYTCLLITAIYSSFIRKPRERWNTNL